MRAGGAVDEERREGAPDLRKSILLGFDGYNISVIDSVIVAAQLLSVSGGLV